MIKYDGDVETKLIKAQRNFVLIVIVIYIVDDFSKNRALFILLLTAEKRHFNLWYK